MHSTNQTTLLATARANLCTPTQQIKVRLLIDSGSEVSLISESISKLAALKRRHSTLTIMGIGGKIPIHSRGTVLLSLNSTYSDATVKIIAEVLPTINIRSPSSQTSSQPWKNPQHIKLADPSFFTPQSIDIIIGADFYGQIIKPNIIRQPALNSIAQLSIFGWLIIGTAANDNETNIRHALIVNQNIKQDRNLDEMLTRFWIQEEIPEQLVSNLSPEEEQCEQHFKTTHQRDQSGRYIVRMPLNSERIDLGDSFKSSIRRLQQIKKKLNNNQEYCQLYTEFMRVYEKMGHMTVASNTPTTIINENHAESADFTAEMTLAHDTSVSGGLRVSHGESAVKAQSHTQTIYYLPHHGVLRPDSNSTKLRVVFDGSCITSSGKSLNDFLHIGAKIQPDITDVLLYVRQHRYIVSSDIEKMFRQINVHQDDWDLQRILWFNDNQEITPYHLTTVTYGTRSAPFLAVRVLQQLIEDEGDKYPLAVPALTYGRYVDDIFGGADTASELKSIATQLKQICMAGGFPLAKWQSNSEEVRKFISPAEANDEPLQLGDCTSKLLGLYWQSRADNLTFLVKDKSSCTQIASKRTILSEVAQIYDPLGFLAPLTVQSKLLLQELWLLKIGWDQQAPTKQLQSWQSLRADLQQIESIKIPRWIHTSKATRCELHGFCDASQLATAAAIYVCVHKPSGETLVSLLCAKTKVAPLNRITIPRLELSAALLLSKLINYVKATLTVDVQSTTLWTDSTVTLTWIKTQASRWKDYVRNRVVKIQQLTSDCNWRYVPGKQNPADCASRGITLAQLQSHSLWWTGPPWLSMSSDHWPRQPDTQDDTPSHEARPGLSLVMTTTQPTYQWDIIFRYSKLRTLIHVTATIYRAIDTLRRIPRPSSAATLTPTDIEKATLYWAKATQAAYFALELQQLKANRTLPNNHPFHRLTSFIDENGVIRVGGRLANSALTYNQQHPIILPRHSAFTSLVISAAHLRTLHGGTQLTMEEIRHTYWIVGGRPAIKSFILRCMKCARQRGKRAQQLMGQLPSSRVQPSRAFLHTGVDYAGPITIKSWRGRGAKQFKGWICVFVCMSTSAVHIEVVTDYTSESFIAAYRRFSARRGICHTLYSDCGTTFLGADATLKKMFTQGSSENQSIASIIINDSTHWQFNPPAAPHMGGKWEAAVKSIKFHLARTTGDTSYSLDEITTLLTQIEAILNSRPLEPLSDDPDDLATLTPGHFLIGQALTTLPEATLQSINITRLSRWQLLQHQLQQFWKNWSTSYLQRQLATTKWWHPNNQLQVGSLVLLTDERLPPCKWPLARITQLHPGPDGLTRVATIKTAITTLVRPIAKLAILPHCNDMDQKHAPDGGRNVSDCPR